MDTETYQLDGHWEDSVSFVVDVFSDEIDSSCMNGMGFYCMGEGVVLVGWDEREHL